MLELNESTDDAAAKAPSRGSAATLCAQLWAWNTKFTKQIPNLCVNPYIIHNNILNKYIVKPQRLSKYFIY